jgi:hypothetical protein
LKIGFFEEERNYNGRKREAEEPTMVETEKEKAEKKKASLI